MDGYHPAAWMLFSTVEDIQYYGGYHQYYGEIISVLSEYIREGILHIVTIVIALLFIVLLDMRPVSV